MDATLINAKGFGGNNATAAILSPHVTTNMLAKKHGANAMKQHMQRNENVQAQAAAYDIATTAGHNALIYKFGLGVIDGDQLEMTDQAIAIPGHTQTISLAVPNPYEDMT